MKNSIKIIVLCVISALLISSISFYGNTIVVSEDTVSESSSVDTHYSYGIFTEKYNIQYHKDSNGNIVMSPEDLEELYTLSKDLDSVKKILNDKEISYTASNKAISLPSAAQTTYTLKQLEVIRADDDSVIISSTTSEDSVDNLTNFTSDIAITKAFPLEEDGFGLRIRYRWWWDYDPVNTWQDKVYIAWSDNLDTLGDETLPDGTLLQDKFYYYQTGCPLNTNTYEYDYDNPYKHTALALKGKEAISQVFTAAGFEKKFDIKCNFTLDDTQYRVIKHSGSMYVTVGRGTVKGFDKIFSFYGTYLHKVLNVGDASLSISPGSKDSIFSMSAVAEMIYDKARDVFDEIKYSEILAIM